MNHPSEDDIQVYAMTPEESPEMIARHIRSCGECSNQVNIYKQIFTQIGALPVASIDVEAVAQAVREQSAGIEKLPIRLLVFISFTALLFILFTIFLFSKSADFLSMLVSDAKPLYALIITLGILIVIFQVLDHMRRFKTLNKTFSHS